jgi:phenylpropionate dioxygenase-like ring-hydroxylating dioxygenase large terminal subunit
MAIEWWDILAAAELRRGDVLEISHRGMDLLIFRTRSGALRAMEAYCPHMNNYIPSGLGPDQDLACLLRDEELVCPFHGWHFDGLGYCTRIPESQSTPARVARGEQVIRSWQIREAGGAIQIGGVQSHSNKK